MIPKYRAWDKEFNLMSVVTRLDYWSEIVEMSDGELYIQKFDKVELMSSTGVFDKNGKEIFEGDILKSNKYITSVFYERGAYRVKIRRTPNTTVIMDVISFIEKYKTKIVGNIYENKELLDA